MAAGPVRYRRRGAPPWRRARRAAGLQGGVLVARRKLDDFRKPPKRPSPAARATSAVPSVARRDDDHLEARAPIVWSHSARRQDGMVARSFRAGMTTDTSIREVGSGVPGAADTVPTALAPASDISRRICATCRAGKPAPRRAAERAGGATRPDDDAEPGARTIDARQVARDGGRVFASWRAFASSIECDTVSFSRSRPCRRAPA